jgi:putative sigma-54 modulation protein
MQLNLTGHHVDVTPAMRDYVEEKLQKLERHFDHVTGIHCILTVEKLRHKAEAKVSLSGGSLFADAVEDDMYAAVDSLVDKLDRQIIRHKEKITDHHARHADKRS